MAERAGDGMQRQSAAMRRRGLIAGAAALVAGLAAKQASQPVAATSGTGTDGNFVLGSNDIDNTTNYASARTELVSGFSFHGQVLLDCNVSPFQSSGATDAIGVSGMSRGTAAGVYGSDTPGQKPAGYPANMNAGVYGYTSAQGHSGVRGDGGTYGIGVQGQSDGTTGIGVIGASAAGVGLKGAATTGFPVIGQVVGPTSINAGVLGVGTTGPGVQGQSTSGHGLVGTTSGTDGVHAAVIDSVQPGSNAIGVRGSPTGTSLSMERYKPSRMSRPVFLHSPWQGHGFPRASI